MQYEEKIESFRVVVILHSNIKKNKSESNNEGENLENPANFTYSFT